MFKRKNKEVETSKVEPIPQPRILRETKNYRLVHVSHPYFDNKIFSELVLEKRELNAMKEPFFTRVCINERASHYSNPEETDIMKFLRECYL